MLFFLGWLCGVGTAVAWRYIRRRKPRPRRQMHGVEKPDCRRGTPLRREWAETRNFLYYDGSNMPEIKEEAYGKNR